MAQPLYGAIYCIAAESEAVAATITVEFRHCLFSNNLAILTTDDLFWPIATYILIVSKFDWFKILSTAIDVLPVLVSPIINSLCPCPIGTKLSIT